VENDYNTAILNSNLSFPLLKELAADGDEKARRVMISEVRERALHGSSVTRNALIEMGMGDFFDDATLAELSEDDDESIRAYVASDARTPSYVLVTLASDVNAEVRLAVSNNDWSPEDAIAILAVDDDPEIRLNVAENCGVPGILDTLSRDDDDDVRVVVASNESASSTTLDAMSRDAAYGTYDVRHKVVWNSNTARETLVRMAMSDEDDDIRIQARKALRERGVES
jgi:hypothetical protein